VWRQPGDDGSTAAATGHHTGSLHLLAQRAPGDLRKFTEIEWEITALNEIQWGLYHGIYNGIYKI